MDLVLVVKPRAENGLIHQSDAPKRCEAKVWRWLSCGGCNWDIHIFIGQSSYIHILYHFIVGFHTSGASLGCPGWGTLPTEVGTSRPLGLPAPVNLGSLCHLWETHAHMHTNTHRQVHLWKIWLFFVSHQSGQHPFPFHSCSWSHTQTHTHACIYCTHIDTRTHTYIYIYMQL